MNTEITTELLLTVYKRSIAFATTKWTNGEPKNIKIDKDGGLIATWSVRWCGDWQDESEYFNAEDLVLDLDEVAKAREERLKKEAEERKERQAKEQVERERIQKQQRKEQYLELKKEFD